MLAEIGLTSTVLAFAATIYAIVVATIGGRTHNEKLVVSARNAAIATFPLLTVACGVLLIGLMTEQYQINYVRATTDPQTPMFYRVTALWGSQEGSLLFWSMLMSLFTMGAMVINWHNERRLMPYVIAYSMAVLAFFLTLSLFFENPFERVWLVPSLGTTDVIDSVLIPPNAMPPDMTALEQNARGLNPLLRHFGMIIHPPMLYLGFVGFVIPFAFAMAALASGDLSTNWIKATRRWTLVAWLFLSLGLVLGGRWAYDVLGWGGYWGWDPVENAAFLPWLVGTAFLHSVMIQEKRGMLKVWNMFLIIGTFSAMMFGTFATRSGLIESVHSFARSSIGVPMFLFWSGITLVSVAMILWRWNRGELKDEHHNTGFFSRETMFVLNNVVFMALTIAIFWGSFGAPIISELFLDEQITLGPDYFMQVTPPLFALLYILMGVAPITAWGATSLSRLGRAMAIPFVLVLGVIAFLMVTGTTDPLPILAYSVVSFAGFVALYEVYRGARARMRSKGENPLVATLALFTRNRRRYGGYIVHLGITIIGLGVIGSTLYQFSTEQTLSLGDTVAVNDGYAVRFDDFRVEVAADGRVIDRGVLTVLRDGERVAVIEPRIDNFPTMPMTISGAHSTFENDFYAILLDFDRNTFETATFRIYINPLINLVWWGSLVLILGTFVSAWPNETKTVTVRDKSKVSPQVKPAGASA